MISTATWDFIGIMVTVFGCYLLGRVEEYLKWFAWDADPDKLAEEWEKSHEDEEDDETNAEILEFPQQAGGDPERGDDEEIFYSFAGNYGGNLHNRSRKAPHNSEKVLPRHNVHY